ncbi:GNAT family N-acetyltransferase [Ectobacillus ponti]|uniref:GNAT family N-acetyltransferase n=1 Tax=Ectobacillus ponti TaxID=2961894 RepID=A0AA41XA57_9BACI|nr:GNAT family N-acetyltransferase [Ectobacillus ponti]MCP8969544.1 GNAT family N-acetyltransferase [Ectobacillus ponti]
MFTMKRAGEAELQEIYELAGINHREATGYTGEDGRDKMISAYEHSFRFGAYFLCAKEADMLAGWVMIDKSMDYLTGEEIGWINDIFVKEQFRGQGCATALMEAALREFQEFGYEEVKLNVYTHNDKAMRLYEKFGFADVNKFMGRKL